MQLLNLLVSTSCLFLLLFSMHLFFAKKGNKLLNVLLSLIFFSRFGQIVTIVLATSGQSNFLSVAFLAFTPLYYAAPACFYLYISCIIDDRTELKKLQWLHFIPALLAIIHVTPWPTATEIDWNSITRHLAAKGYFSLKVRSGLFPSSFHYILRPLLVLSYLTLAWFKLLRSKTAESKNPDQSQRFWILFFLRTATFFQTLSLVPAFLTMLHIPYTLTSFVIVNCLALLAIILYTLHKPNIFYGHLLVAVDWKKKPEPLIRLTEDTGKQHEIRYIEKEENEKPLSKPGKKVKIPANQLAEYSFSMKKLMEEAELYLLHDFQIIDLAAKLDIPVHHCSYIINNHIGKNFRDWINGYRVNYFLKQYPIKGDKITIEAIANESGFKSLATFYNAFKKEKGAMPSHYLNQEESRKLLNK